MIPASGVQEYAQDSPQLSLQQLMARSAKPLPSIKQRISTSGLRLEDPLSQAFRACSAPSTPGRGGPEGRLSMSSRLRAEDSDTALRSVPQGGAL